LKTLGGLGMLYVFTPGNVTAISQSPIIRRIPVTGELLPVIGMGSSRTFDVDDDASDAVWNWDISVDKNDHFNNTNYVGVYFNQKVNKWNDNPVPLGSGESWSTPWGYVTLDFEVADVDYKEYTFAMEINYDINSTHEQDVLLITAEGQASSNDGLDYEGQDTNRIAVNDSGAIFYEDSDGDFQIGAGAATAGGKF